MAGKLLSILLQAQRFVEHLQQQQPRWKGFAEALALLLLIGCIDVATGYQATLTVFYSLPILLAVWRSHPKFGFGVAALAAVTWWAADIAAGHVYSSIAVHGWEISVRCGFFFAVAFAGTAVRERQDAAAARIALLEHSRLLEQQIIEVSEYEQQRIGQDLHDGICQYLAAVGCAASSLQRDLETEALPKFASAAEEIAELVMRGVAETRNLARGLLPVQIGDRGLPTALQELADSSTRLLGTDCTFEASGTAVVRDDACAVHLFRIAQEGISNATRHGKAQRIELRLSANEHVTTLSVADDGVGISRTGANARGMGISIMRYRASVIGGELSIEERTPHGTILSCSARPRAALLAS